MGRGARGQDLRGLSSRRGRPKRTVPVEGNRHQRLSSTPVPIIDIEALRQKVALACRSLYTAGLIDVRGHVSVRVPGTDRILVLGHLHPTRRVAADATRSDVIQGAF